MSLRQRLQEMGETYYRRGGRLHQLPPETPQVDVQTAHLEYEPRPNPHFTLLESGPAHDKPSEKPEGE